MKQVIADQAAATGFSSVEISAIERGAMKVPEAYLEKLAGWMELSEDEMAELAVLATLDTHKVYKAESIEEILSRVRPTRQTSGNAR